MKNSFKKILTKHEVPKVLKDKILDDINMIRRTFYISDAFLMKFPNTLSDYFINEETSSNIKE
jgi:hypothetical protein